MRRRLVGASMAVGIGIGAALLGGCGSGNALSLAEQACGHVHKSLALYEQSLREPASGQAALQQKAATQLRLALPLAAAATSADGSWNPLMTDLSEISRVPEEYLVPGLSAQCSPSALAAPGQSQATLPPGSPSTTPGTTAPGF